MCGRRGVATMALMSFLKKAAAAAAVAKSQLDEVREQRAAASVKPIAAAGPSDHEQQVVARSMALGAPDPYSLLSFEQACAAAGRELGGPGLTYSDDMLGVKYEASGGGNHHYRVAVSAFHAIDESGFDAREHWRSYVADLVEDGRPVPGLGDAALAREQEVFVLDGDRLLMVEVTTPEADGDRDRAIALAREVV